MAKPSIFRRRKVRHTAKRLVDVAYEGRDEVVIGDLIAAAARLSGLDELCVTRGEMPSGYLATTVVSDTSGQIKLSARCTAGLHTLCHELGHLVLGHSHRESGCLAEEIGDCPSGFERMQEVILGGEPVVNPRAYERMEIEAEMFADEAVHLFVSGQAGASLQRREFSYGMG